MPVERSVKRAHSSTAKELKSHSSDTKKLAKPVAVDEDVAAAVHPYPKSAKERADAINRHTGRKITPFQFQVYDLCLQIPEGQISTYKHISDALKSSSRAVGQALKVNPYAPLPVPCHRVLDSKLYIGGYMGQWGEGEKIDDKRAKLYHEGIVFDETDHVVAKARNNAVFTDFKILE
ncbi:6-O-methylguanine DNA methyltransferase [Gamsiella multidivaricata]|uniref:6-O-methylguanine DNA methyltransferase n=1 Tax=Gamsiella multidivaricata TaxID=101098 RepID=UPI00222039D4|nr:6-O-methylguanine DNA methyltransferase [Gamsiella multidivaricata]KAI7822014.1 6-O-methylguanine DNA methyltransferase [Gamsiella multidivaricata]